MKTKINVTIYTENGLELNKLENITNALETIGYSPKLSSTVTVTAEKNEEQKDA